MFISVFNVYVKKKHGLKIKPITVPTVVRLLLIACAWAFIAGCSQNSRPEANSKGSGDTLLPPQRTILSALPESHKPKIKFLENAPKPSTVKVSSIYPGNMKQPHVAPAKEKGSQISQQINSFIDNTANRPIAADAQGKGFFTTYTTDDGLGLDQVYCSYKDKRGNLWFGTNGGGVSKYDGKNFTNYTTAQGLANNVVWCITEDDAGNLWFGTDGSGVSKYDGEHFTNFTTSHGLAANVVFTIKGDKKNNLWFGTLNGGVSKYDGKSFTNYSTVHGLAGNIVKSIIEDHLGNFWFGTLGGGVSKYDGKNFTNYTAEQGLAKNGVWSIAEDNLGNIWFGTEGNGISKFDGTTFTNFTVKDGLADDVVLSIVKDKKGNLWLGTLKGGISKYDGKSFTNYTTSQGLANNTVRTITEDEKGNLWFGTYGGGISKYAGNSFTNFTTAQGLPNNVVFSIAGDSIGNIWLGTSGGGVSKYDGRRFTSYNKSHGLAHNVIYCIAKDRSGNLWFGTSGAGVSKYDGKSFTNYTTEQGLANNVIFSILEDKNGTLWFGTSGGGVSKYDGKSFTSYTKSQGLAGNVVFSILEDEKGSIWFGTLGGGVSEYDGESFTNYTVAQGLANNSVWTITQDKPGNLWFGTQQGLSMLGKEKVDEISENKKNNKTSAGPAFRSFTTKDGLPDNFITQVVQGNNNKLYIGTNLGFCELIPADTAKGHKKNWTVGRIFNSQSGYPVKDVNAGLGAMFKDSTGIIWIGTGSDKTGLVRFDPAALIDNNLVPTPVFIKNVKINNENICWSDLDTGRINEKIDSNTTPAIVTDEVNTYGRQLSDTERDSLRTRFQKLSFDGLTKWNPIPKHLVLPYYYNNIGFDFNSIETGKNFLVKYQYMLDGYDKDWSPPDYKTSVNFGNINDGTYTFRLRAQSPEGVWSEPVTYTFKVLPPWWKTWWMYLIYAILVIAFILLIFRWNTRRIISQKKMLENRIIVATRQIREENQKVNAQKKKIEETLKELEATQAQLIQSEKMAGLGELTAGIAHEIQNPLNFVNNFSEVNSDLIDELQNELEAGNTEDAFSISNEIKENEQKINHHGKRAEGIVKGMLQHSRSSTGHKEPVDINALADEYLRLSYHGFRAKDKLFNATIKTDFYSGLEKISIVPQDIGRVLLNLYNNAFYAVAEKKKLQPETYEPTISVSTRKINNKVEIRVEDNGNGIPQKIVDKIFQPFFTTKPTGQGTGLGLSLSYDIVKAHSGEIKVETKEGEGTEFIINLPIQ